MKRLCRACATAARRLHDFDRLVMKAGSVVHSAAVDLSLAPAPERSSCLHR
jgi:hypothetical protein